MKTFESMDTLDIPFHHRIMHHVKAHVQKHQKKYILGSGIFSIVVLVAVFVWASIVTNLWNAGYEETKALFIFSQIDDIAHQRAVILKWIGEDHFLIWFADFYKIDVLYHEASDITTKFKLAQQLDSLIYRQDAYLVKWSYVTPDQEAIFNQLEKEFDSQYNFSQVVSFTGRSENFKQNALDIFTQLFAIAGQRNEVINILGKDSFVAWWVWYREYTAAFNQTQNIQEKYQLAKKIDNMLYRQDYYFHLKWYIGNPLYITTGDDALYHQAHEQLTALK